MLNQHGEVCQDGQWVVMFRRDGRAVTATTFDDAFLAQVRRRPDATAVVFGADACTYAELDRRVAGMAAQLAGAGVGAVAGAGDRVVLVADNSVGPPRRRPSPCGGPGPRS